MWELSLAITDEDIWDGERDSTNSCAIALALQRYFNATYASVYPDHSLVFPKQRLYPSYRFTNNQDAQDFIAAYDDETEQMPPAQTVTLTLL